MYIDSSQSPAAIRYIIIPGIWYLYLKKRTVGFIAIFKRLINDVICMNITAA